jgi:hypothetical protein
MKAKKNQPPFVNFSVDREYLDHNGLWNSRDGDLPLEAAFQVNVFGSSEHYLRLAEFFREFAERDRPVDHEHFEGLLSTDGNVRLHVILRKDDIGDSGWRECLPPAIKKKRQGKSR